MNPSAILFIVHDSPLRSVSDSEAISTLTPDELALPRYIERVDTRGLADDVDEGSWITSVDHLRDSAARIRAMADKVGATRLRHLGIAEVPHLIALGAYFGDERLIDSRDFDRNLNQWGWRTTDATLELVVEGSPSEAIAYSGEAVIRVEISYPVNDADVDAVVPRNRLADIRIKPASQSPAIGLVRSSADVQAIRAAVGEALAALATSRPSCELIHLVVAAPVSACIAIGQELRLRNGKDIQTYRYRSGSDGHALTRAILLTDGVTAVGPRRLSDDDRALARQLRNVWSAALDEVKRHAASLRAEAQSQRWYDPLRPDPLVRSLAPFPELKPIWQLVDDRHRISPDTVAEFGFDKEKQEWELDDHLILGMHDAAGKDEARLREFARLFFWHEYLHFWQGITKYTAIGIGQLANCLERADYVADVYALLHQIDFITRQLSPEQYSEDLLKNHLLDQTGVAISSFWTFEPPPPMKEMQERRLRRYLNWYWRRAQLVESANLSVAYRVLSRQPCIEITGLHRKSGGGNRINVRLHEPNGVGQLHIGIMMEDGRLVRHGSSVDASIAELVNAFRDHKRSEIEKFFNSKVDHLRDTPGAVTPNP